MTYVVGNDIRGLHHHIIQRAGNRPCPHGACVPRGHGHDNRMDIRRPKKKYQNDPPSPGTGLRGQHFQRNQQNQAPDLGHDTQEEPNIEALRDPSPEEQVDDEDRVRGDSQEIGLEGLEPQRLELQRDVARRRRVGDQPRQAEQVDDPHVVVAERLPEHLGSDGLPIMHAAFAGVVAEDSVDEDLFLVLVEPPVLSAEATFRLRG